MIRKLRASLTLGCALVATVFASAQPPVEPGPFKQVDLVELTTLDPTIHLDIRYATMNNMLGRAVYSQPRAFLQRPAAEALVRANKALRAHGFGLLVFDGYRPWHVTKQLWDHTPRSKKMFVADPKLGSRHNRGCAVDLTLYDLKTGAPVPMPSAYDEMTERAYADYAGAAPEEKRMRELLASVMVANGFAVFATEWWHFDHADWRSYPVLDLTFPELR